jgi:hypothetical protein
MSEYQSYEFQAIDRLLTDQEMKELRGLSTRAAITRSSFTNEYHWGNFRGDPRKMMERYFDAFVYWANWGTRWLMLRLPRALVDVQAAEQYCGENLFVVAKRDFVVFEFHSSDESGDWREEWDVNWMSSLVPVRDDLMRGDLRALYLAWLAGMQRGEFEEDELEPPVPPGLRSLSGSLASLAGFLRIDDDLLETAAEADQGAAPPEPSEKEFGAWLRSLPESDKDSLLLSQFAASAPRLHEQLLHRFRQETDRPSATAAGKRRTAGELTDAWQSRADQRRQREAEAHAKRREEEMRKKAAEREKYLDSLAGREAQVWTQITKLIDKKNAAKYDLAVQLLADLRDAAARTGEGGKFAIRLAKLRQQNARKPSFLERLDKQGLL